MNDAAFQADQLVSRVAEYQRCVVAFSGGVDSALVAKAAALSLGPDALAVTAVSAFLTASTPAV